jgi:crotonobetainyl-CoA:carnitine CoA-transferase CaiB-like acyl-CoA transferase
MAVTAQAWSAAVRPLAGLRVVEVATFVAAPPGGMTLAQLGADVIRVDPLGGAADYTRWPLAASGTSLYWTGLNKAKHSLCADLRSAEDIRANPMMGTVDQPGVGPYLAPASPIRVGEATGRELVRAPALGEHSAEILRADLGLGESQIRDLHERGVVASASAEARAR